MKKVVFAFIFIFSTCCSANSTYDSLFEVKGAKYGVDPLLLKAIATHESSLNPWAANVHGEGFYFKSKNHALRSLRFLAKNQWMVKVRHKDSGKFETLRKFVSTEHKARSILSSYSKNRISDNKTTLPVYYSSKTKGSSEYIVLRKLNIESTDIGLGQINYRYHDKPNLNVSDWFDPNNNIDYQASLISVLLKKHIHVTKALGFYHSRTPSLQEKYIRLVMPIYNKLKKSQSKLELASN